MKNPAIFFAHPPSGEKRLARNICFKKNAVPNSTARLRSNLRASNEENWLFQSVQRKKNEKSQKRSPRSGNTELKACAEAKKSVSSVRTC